MQITITVTDKRIKQVMSQKGFSLVEGASYDDVRLAIKSELELTVEEGLEEMLFEMWNCDMLEDILDTEDS